MRVHGLLTLIPCFVLVASAGCGGGDGSTGDDGGELGSEGGDGDGGDWPVQLAIVDHEHELAADEEDESLFTFEVVAADQSYELDRLTLFVKSGPGSSYGTRILLDVDDGTLDLGDTGTTSEEGDRYGAEHAGSDLEVRLTADWATAEPIELFEGTWSAE